MMTPICSMSQPWLRDFRWDHTYSSHFEHSQRRFKKHGPKPLRWNRFLNFQHFVWKQQNCQNGTIDLARNKSQKTNKTSSYIKLLITQISISSFPASHPQVSRISRTFSHNKTTPKPKPKPPTTQLTHLPTHHPPFRAHLLVLWRRCTQGRSRRRRTFRARVKVGAPGRWGYFWGGMTYDPALKKKRCVYICVFKQIER